MSNDEWAVILRSRHVSSHPFPHYHLTTILYPLSSSLSPTVPDFPPPVSGDGGAGPDDFFVGGGEAGEDFGAEGAALAVGREAEAGGGGEAFGAHE